MGSIKKTPVRKTTVTNRKIVKKTISRRRTYANARNRSTKVRAKFVDVLPHEVKEIVGEAGSVPGKMYNPEEVFQVNPLKHPSFIMRQALESGIVKVPSGDKEIECKVGGVRFSLIENRTKSRISYHADLEEAKKVFLEGKDVEVFDKPFKESVVEHNKKIEFVENLVKLGKSSKEIREDFAWTQEWPSWGNAGNGPWNTDWTFTPLGNGPMNQQLYLHDYWEMIAKAFEQYHHNPYAHRAIEIIVNFVLGRGYAINFHDGDLQALWDEDVYRLRLNEQMYVWMRDLERSGNLYLRPIFDPITGALVEVQSLEASTILEVFTDISDPNKIHGYYQQYMTPIQVYAKDDADRQVEFVINTYDAAEIIHVKINNTGAEKVGRSTLFPALEYLKMVRDYQCAATNKAIASACLILDWAITGNQGDVQTIAQSIPPLNWMKPISSLYHSDKVKVTPVVATQMRGRDEALNAIINAIAVATGVGKDYLGASDVNSSRANSLAATEPATKNFEQRQNVANYHILRPLIEKWIDARIEAGTINPTKIASVQHKLNNAIAAIRTGKLGQAVSHLYSAINGRQVEIALDRSVDITFPEIVKGDLTQMIENYGYMQSMGWWSAARAATLATNEFGTIKGYDYFEEQQEIGVIGIKPIATAQAQSLMCDKDNPPGSQLASMQPKPGSPGVSRQLGPPKSSNQNDTSMNVVNHPGGSVGAAALRNQAGTPTQETRVPRILGTIIRRFTPRSF